MSLRALAPEVDELAGQHQAPGRGIDEDRFRLAQMAVPVLAADLVGDQLVGRLGIRNAQQRLGQAHQHHALFGGERVFLHEGVDAALLAAAGPHRRHELAGEFGHAALLVGGKRGLRRKAADQRCLVGKQPVGDGGCGWAAGSWAGLLRWRSHGRNPALRLTKLTQ